jgi:hypothetical protein
VAPQPATLFDLADVATSAELASRWPLARVRWEHGDYDEQSAEKIVDHLQKVLTLDNVVSAVAPTFRAPPDDAVGAERPALSITADVHVDLANDADGPLGVVHKNLSDFTLRLVTTDGNHPARLSWARFADDTSELTLLGLPVQIEPPRDMLFSADIGDKVPFDATHPDSLGLWLAPQGETTSPTYLKCFVTLRLTRDQEVIIEPTVPLSIGRCIFMSLPCRAVHDIGLYPDVAAAFRPAHLRELPIGWTEKDDQTVLHGRVASDQGLVTVRTLELDRDDDAVKDVYTLLAPSVYEDHPPLEVPLEDLGLAFDAEGGFPIPAYPVYGYTGIRRAVDSDTAQAEPFDFRLAPITLPIKDWVYVHVFRCLVGLTIEPVLNFDVAITRTVETDTTGAMTVSFTQDQTLLLGYAPPEPQRLFRVGNAEMSFLAGRLGVRLATLVDPGSQPRSKVWKWLDALLDLGLAETPETLPKKKIAFKTRSGADLDLVLRDVGWKDGKPSVSAWVPEGIDLQVLGARGFHIDEIGLATTTHGATYFRLSASYQVGGDRKQSAKPDSPQHPPGNGIWLRGLRIRVQDPDDADAPALAIDGIVISIRASDGSDVEGGGWLRDEVVDGNRIRELGFGIRIFKPAGSTEFVFGGTFVKGSMESAERTIEYLLAGVTLGPIPIGSFTILRGSILVARNFVPKLPAPSGVEQNLRLFQWYRAQPNALELPPGRVLGAWEPHPDSWTLGAGLRVIIGSSSVVKLDVFGLWLKTPETWELLVGLELLFKSNPNPIAWFAVDYDDTSGRWAATGGLALSMRDVLEKPDIPGVVEVTGSAYVANHPRTVAIGHIEDVDSWLQFKTQYARFDLLLRIGFCFYSYDGDPEINAYGFVVTGRGQFQIPHLTQVKFLLELSVLLGSFSSEGKSAGILASIKAGLSVTVWHIRFGVSAGIEVEDIRPQPDAGTATVHFTIETPWWLPDIHVSHTFTFGDDPDLQLADVVALPVRGSQALGLAGGTAVDLATPPPAGAGDPARAYSLSELAALGPPTADDALFDDLTPVAVDSVVAVDFAATMTDQLGTGETTPLAASRQANGELWADYEVIELGVRRRARYGPDAGAWTTLLAPEDTSTAAIDPTTDSVADLVAKFTSELSFRWDRDNVRGGKLDARRLLVNAATPFTLTTANPIADDTLLRDPDATCCGRKSVPPWVRLDFESDPIGVRLPRVSDFPGGAAHARWNGALTPVVTGDATSHQARIPLTGRMGTTLATVTFDQPAARVLGRIQWSSPGPAVVRFELRRGLDVVAVRDVVLDPQQEATVDLRDGNGADELVIRLLGHGPLPLPTLYVDALAYVSRAGLTNWLLGLVRCSRGGTVAGSTLAWLPNHDYEIAVTCRTTVGHDRIGSASVPVTQTALFRTKGWPGLNAPATPGGDLSSFVESAYPRRPEQVLYRDEPILLVMNERFAPLAPPVDAPPTAPPERRQLLEWTMLVDEVGNGAAGAVATYPSPDWLTAHRQEPGPAGPAGARGDVVVSRLRQAPSVDPRLQRLDGLRRSPANCTPHDPSVHASRVFACPAPPDGWEQGGYRARVVQRNGPYVFRTAFEAADLTALTMLGDEGAGAWTVDNGALVAGGDAGRSWGVLGDDAWMHVHLVAELDLAGGGAGLAVAVGGAGGNGDAVVAIVDAAAGRLTLERRRGGTQNVAAEAPVTLATTPVTLELVAYDDEVVARVGDVEVRASRGDQREGRVALLASAGVRVSRLTVEPVEAYAIDAVTSRWRTFEDHIAAYRDAAPLAIGASAADLAVWLSSEWQSIGAAMAADADPRVRATAFRGAVEALGIAAVESPTEPTVTCLQAGGATVGVLLEGPEPLPFSRDVIATLQRRVHWPPPFPPPHPPFDPPVLEFTTAASLGPTRLPGLVHPPLPPIVVDPGPEPGPISPPPWVDVTTLVLTDDDERRALIFPVASGTHAPLDLGGPVVRIRFDLDRERYRSATGDPDARTQGSVTRSLTW